MCLSAVPIPSSLVLSSSGPTHGLTQLGLRSYPSGRLYPRPLQRYFHSLGLTDRFIPPLGPCQLTPALAGSVFSYLWNPYSSFPGGFYDFHGRLYVCNCFKLQPSSVHVSDSGATSPGSGCSVSGLAGEVNVHVSSVSPAQQGYSETMVDTGGRSNSDSPLVVMVSTPTSSLCGSSTVLSLPPRSSVTTLLLRG